MLSDNPSSRILALAIVLMMALVPFGANEQASADTIDTFGTGNAKETYTFTSSGALDTIYLRVPVDGTVMSATMDVTGQVNTGDDYPSNVRAFVGTLNGQVYQFSGPAVGKMGLQQTFNDGETSKTIVFSDAGTDDSMYVRLPRGADITSAQIRFKGGLEDAGWDEPVRLSQQSGQNTVPIDVGWRSSPQLIDWDGDGDLDVLSGAYMTQPTRYLAYYENTGTKSSFTWSYDISDFNTIRAAGGYYSAPTLIDLDDDGDHDMVFGGYNGYLRLYWNTGSDASPTWFFNGSAVNNPNTVFYGIDEGYYADPEFADMDNDGDVDMAYGRYSSGGTSTVGVSSYRNDYNNGVYSWATHNFFGGIGTDQMSSPCLFDFDEDGDFDMFVGYYNGTIGYYENTGSKIKPSWTQRMKVQGNIDVGTMSAPAVGDLDDDGDYDLLVGAQDGQFYYYENLLSYPTDAKLNIGKDDDIEKHFVGEYMNTSVVSGFEDELESHLGVGRPAFRDQWGNEFDDILLSLSSESPGRMTVDSIRIAYTYTKTTRDFAEILNDYIDDNAHKADSEGYLKVPVIVASNSKGKVELSNLKIVMDRAPKWSTVPSTFGIDEDTKNTKLIDILAYVIDDFTGTDKLTLEVFQIDQQGIITVSLNDGHYVSVDAETGTANDNWNGQVTIMLMATDGTGQSAKSNEFTVQVRPVNDPPILRGEPPSTTLEDAKFSYQIDAFDIDGDILKYTIYGMPTGMKLSEKGLVTWLPTNDDVGMYSMSITVEDPYGLSAILNWTLEVINVNDPPTITLPGEITVTEGKPYLLDISNAITDVDNSLSELNIIVENSFASLDLSDMVITLLYPKESGMEVDRLLVAVTDPSGDTVTAMVTVYIIRVEKLDLAGIPDQQAVEEDTWTLDIKPYLYNVEDFNNLVITTSSSYVTVTGTRLTLHYPRDSLPSLTETVTVQARQGEESATAAFTVTLLKLGYDLTLTIIPQQDVLENEVVNFDITPYIKNAADINDVIVTVKASTFVTVSGKVITFGYPLYHGPETETVLVSIQEGDFGASSEFLVRILDGEDDFYLGQVPDVTVTETIPETFNIKAYINNAYNIDFITASTDSAYADVNRFDIKLTYPAGFTMDEPVRDDIIRITVTDGIHTFTRAVNVHVNRLGKDLQLSGIGDRVVFEDASLVIDVEPYLYNVDDIGMVTLFVAPSTYTTVEGFVVTFTFPVGTPVSQHQVTFTAREGEDEAIDTITITIEKKPREFSFGAIGSVTVKEGEPFALDVAPFLVNMDPRSEYVLADHSDYVEVHGFVLTFLYDDEVLTDEIVRVNVTGTNGDFAEQDIFVHVNLVNDPPTLIKAIPVSLDVVEDGDPLVIDLGEHFTDVDSSMMFTTTSDLIVIDNENGTATVEFLDNTPKPDDIVDAVITAFDPNDPDSRTATNKFNITFYLKGDDPGPGPGPGPGPNDPSLRTSGASVGLIVGILLVAVAGGIGYMIYKRRNPPKDQLTP